MPFEIRKTPNGKYRLYNLHKKSYAKKTFNTRQASINMGKRWAEYRGEKLIVRGNRLVRA